MRTKSTLAENLHDQLLAVSLLWNCFNIKHMKENILLCCIVNQTDNMKREEKNEN